MTNERIIAITVKRNEHGWFVATSDDLPGLYIAHEERDAVCNDIDEAIVALFAAKGEKVSITPVQPSKVAEEKLPGIFWGLVRPISFNGVPA